MSVIIETSHSRISPCGQSELSPFGDNLMHLSIALCNSVRDCGKKPVLVAVLLVEDARVSKDDIMSFISALRQEVSGPVGASLPSCSLVVVLIATLDVFVVTGGEVSGADTGVAVVGGDAVEFCDVAIVHRVVSVSAVIICL